MAKTSKIVAKEIDVENVEYTGKKLFDKAQELLEVFNWIHTDFSIYEYRPIVDEEGDKIHIGIAYEPNCLLVTFYDREIANSTDPIIITDNSWDAFVSLVRAIRKVNMWQRI